MRTEKEKMLAGELYRAGSPELRAIGTAADRWMDRFNASQDLTGEACRALMAELFAEVGEGCFIRPPFYCDYGANIHLGRNVFMNFNCVVLDVVRVEIGDGTMLAPGVQILAADHPRDRETRASGLEFGRPVVLGADVWVGAGALILPGVTVGDGAIVGAGAVVTRDVAPGATVAGNPAREVRKGSSES